MHSPHVEVLVGPVIHTWEPFQIRSLAWMYSDGQRVPMSRCAVSIMLTPDDELEIASLPLSRANLMGLVTALREKLQTHSRDINAWRRHLQHIQQPEGMAALQAQLDAEVQAGEDDSEKYESLTAVQVVASQQAGLEREENVYEAIRTGLSQLETRFPEISSGTS